jgi:acyl-CoA dehydrogenase
MDLRQQAREAGLFNPHLRPDGSHIPYREMCPVFRAAGLSPLGPVALNIAAPDEGNMTLLRQAASEEQKAKYLMPLVAGRTRSAFLMTEPADWGGAGSDPSMLKTKASWDGQHWIVNGRKAFITGAQGASLAILLAATDVGPTIFLVDLPDPAVRIERLVGTIDSSMLGGHAMITIDHLRTHPSQILGMPGCGFQHAQSRLAPARLTHCMRWLGSVSRAQEVAALYATSRSAFGKPLIEHEGVGFMLADNMIDLKQAELLIEWCAGVLDSGARGLIESSITKVAVSEALFRVADRCVQVMGARGVSRDTIVEQVFREIRSFRIYDGASEVHKWSIARQLQRDFREDGERSTGTLRPLSQAT